jgi:Pentapeptide repeats (9 copies)
LTSRPNYFTQLEELHVLEHLYSSLKSDALSAPEREVAEREHAIDRLFERHILSRYERTLKDLEPEQTESLVSRVLADDPDGRDAVLNVTRRVFRDVERGSAVALSGKPVIITYLLEVVEGLKSGNRSDASRLTEWQVYKLIVDQLMIRDFKRSPELPPGRRRAVLHTLSVYLSKRDTPVITEAAFRDIVRREFRNELRTLDSEQRDAYVERMFADLRSSTTLTRGSDGRESGWRFSHNSLREFLLTEYLSERLLAGEPHPGSLPISDAMRIFAASRSIADRQAVLDALRQLWPRRATFGFIGAMLSLYWDGFWAVVPSPDRAVSGDELLRQVTGTPITLSNTSITGVTVSSELQPAVLAQAEFSEMELIGVDFTYGDLTDAKFTGSLLQSVRFTRSNLSDASFIDAVLEEVDFTESTVTGAEFTNVLRSNPTIFVESADGGADHVRLEGRDAIGYLRFQGAQTDDVPLLFVVKHHPKYPIVDKIVRKLAEQSLRQRRGLVQRGTAQRDTRFAGAFMKQLFASGYVREPKGRADLIEVTELGRDAFSRMIEGQDVPADIAEFLLPKKQGPLARIFGGLTSR